MALAFEWGKVACFRMRRGRTKDGRKRLVRAQSEGSDDGGFSTMRFSTGSAKADREACRAVGVVGLLALFGNWELSEELTAGAQRAELAATLMGMATLVVPPVSDRLEAAAGRNEGKRRTGSLRLAEKGDEWAKEELAWATYALLAASDASAALVVDAEGVLAARGGGDIEKEASRVVALLPGTLDDGAGCTISEGSAACRLGDSGVVALVGTDRAVSKRSLQRLRAVRDKLLSSRHPSWRL